MDELELKKLWRSANEKLEQSIVINKKNTEDIARIQVYTYLGSMKSLKIFTLLVGFLWVGFGGHILLQIYINGFSQANKFFLISATAQIFLTALSLFIYIYQLASIYQVKISDPIFKTQEKLAQLKLSTLWAARILFLQLPVWTTFWWNTTMLERWNFLQWSISLSVTFLFTYVAIWLFFNINSKNTHKKWFKRMFLGKEWEPLMKSTDLLAQITEFKSDSTTGN